MKLKLNIQRFSSTNATSHYELSQYIGTDKPTYLVDYNGDMSKIDTGIYNAQTKANNNESSIGDLSTLTTDSKSSLVGAINEIDAHTDTNTTNISNNTTDIATNTSAIGTLANLETTTKSNLVSAINEVEGNVEKLNLTTFTPIAVSDLTTSNISSITSNVTVATNSDGSVFKLYGQFAFTFSALGSATISFPSLIRPSSNLTITGAGLKIWEFTDGKQAQRLADFSVDTNGVVTITIGNFSSTADETVRLLYNASLYFAKDFGDTPISQ